MPKPFRHALRLLALVAAILGTQGSAPAASCPGMTDLISHGAYGVADTSGRITAGCNLDESLMPASIIKVATVLAAMRILGPDYHFATEFYQDQLGNLYIRGLGDPTLVSEEVARIATRLRSLGLTRVATLFVDDSAFALEGPMPGQSASANPYDAPVAALAVNFNTLAIVKTQADIASGEAQTPELPLMQELARNQASGRMRLNVCMGGADTEQCSIRYAEELFRALLEQAGIRVEGLGGRGVVPQDARLLLRYESSGNLELVAQDLMRSSSNFIANLLFLQAGAKRYGFPATWAKGQKMMQAELRELLGPKAAVHLVEASGISRQDRVSCRSMLTILQRFRPYRGVLQQQHGVASKSGTMSGVYNLAGYLPDGRAYVIMLNQPKNTRDRVLARLQGRDQAADRGRRQGRSRKK